MQPLAHYALLGSLIAGASGALVLAVVTLQHGIQRRFAAVSDNDRDDAARRQRVIRLADSVAVLCFAVSAGLGVVGLMQHTRTVTPAVAATDDAALVERMQALEKRVATTEVELQMRSGGSAAPEWRAWEERIARLENRLGAVEDRAAVAARRDERSRTAPATAARQVVPQASPRQIAPSTPRAVTPPKPAPAPPPPQSVAPRPSPDEGESVSAPEVAASPRVEASAPVAAATPITPPAPPRESPRARVEPPAQDPSLGDKLRRDWDAIKRQARRGGEEWRDGWDQLKRLFGY